MWLFKGDNGKYLHSFRVGFYGRIEDCKWDESQLFAYRFADRNAASSVGAATNVPGTIITLVAGGINKRLDAIEASSAETNATLKAAFEAMRLGTADLLAARAALLPSEVKP